MTTISHCRSRGLKQSARLLSTKTTLPLLRLRSANVYRFGSVQPVFREPFDWTISSGNNDESWGIVGDNKGTILDLLLGRLRITPVQKDGLWPLLTESNPSRDPFSAIAFASFATRQQVAHGGGGFYDYTARYGAVREEDRKTLRDSLWETHATVGQESNYAPEQLLMTLSDRLELSAFLDLPLIALSNGQTRRAQVLRELLKNPEVLVLDEPLTGLDVRHRPRLSKVLYELHAAHHPRIIMGLRRRDPIPEWITHLIMAEKDQVTLGTKTEVLGVLSQNGSGGNDVISPRTPPAKQATGEILVELKGVNVQYHERKVLEGIDWTIREGERWHLQGANGSGKTTLLSMIQGDHPQSYQQKGLRLFGRPRRSTSTIQIQQNIGFVSPELFNAFPRRVGPQGLSVREAIGTGLHSTFSYRPRTAEDDERITALLEELGPSSWSDNHERQETFGNEVFATLPFGEQALVLLLRALVSKPRLLILDEPFAGMNDRMVHVIKRFLLNNLGDKQAAVFISHWEQEVPWPNVQRIQLEDGHAMLG